MWRSAKHGGGGLLPTDRCPQRNETCVTESERTPDSNHRLTAPADYALVACP
jgi:hypothetical protein